MDESRSTSEQAPPMSSIHLPWEIVIDILCRLPVKSLLRFRCVSKKFCSLIDSPDFAELQLNHSICSNSSSRVIIMGPTPADGIFSFDPDSDYATLTDDDVVKLEYPGDIGVWDENFIMGSCNGLVALTHEEDYVVWNPSTDKYIILPDYRPDPWNVYCYYGFGYDVSTDDYKFVKIMATSRVWNHVVFVFSLKTNTWKTIEDFPFHVNDGGRFDVGVFVGSSLNWVQTALGRELPIAPQFIFAFDLRNEKFSSVPLPDIVPDGAEEEEPRIYLSVLGGCLSITSHISSHFDVWVMKEYGVKESWTKLFSLTLFSLRANVEYCLKPLAYSKSGDQVLLDQYGYCLSWYNLQQQQVKPLSIRVSWGFYLDSLDSPNTYTGRYDHDNEGSTNPLLWQMSSGIFVESLVSPNAYAGRNNGGGNTS